MARSGARVAEAYGTSSLGSERGGANDSKIGAQPITVPTTTTTLQSGSSSLTLDERGTIVFQGAGQGACQASALCVLHYYDRQHPQYA